MITQFLLKTTLMKNVTNDFINGTGIFSKIKSTELLCSNCGEIIPDHEKYSDMQEMDSIECIDCEMAIRAGDDIDNFMGC